jgi:Ca-activated chloride channel family protein
MRLIARKQFIAACLLSILSVCFPFRAQVPAVSSDPQLGKVKVSVIDRKGRAVATAKKEDFELFDDGNPGTIEYFSKDESPIVYGLVIDGSGSLKNNFKSIIAAARQLIAANRDRDKTFIIKFVSSDNIRTVNAITADRNELDSTVTSLKVEQGQTALIDGVYLAAQYAIQDPNRPTTLILLSDGEDRASYYREPTLLSLLEKNNLQVFSVGVVGQLDSEQGLVRLSPQQKATNLLTKLAKETGGLAFILNSEKELPSTIERLSEIMRSHYIIGYRPISQPKQPARKVQVKILSSPEHEKWTVINSRIVTN